MLQLLRRQLRLDLRLDLRLIVVSSSSSSAEA
jgi:hypothetical protein